MGSDKRENTRPDTAPSLTPTPQAKDEEMTPAEIEESAAVRGLENLDRLMRMLGRIPTLKELALAANGRL